MKSLREFLQEDYFDTHVAVQYLNKPFFVQLKRVWRAIKKIPNQEKPKKIGFYLQTIRKLPGNAVMNEKIVRDVMGKSQQMTPKKFIERIFEYEVPEGKEFYIKPETAYQTTQRLLPSAKLNKTISVSVFGDIYKKILEKYKNREDFDDIVRNVNKFLSAHFANAAAFVRWTKLTPNWIHIDALQTDFFNRLKALSYKNDYMKDIITDFRKHEDEFFKTAFSYIVRSNPQVKVYTMNTPEVVSKVENVRGDVKLKEYYYKLPKKLGFRLIPLDKFYSILRTRPGKKTEALIKKFNKAFASKTEKATVNKTALRKINSIIGEQFPRRKTMDYSDLTKDKLDAIINPIIAEVLRGNPTIQAVQSGYHQLLDELYKLIVEKKPIVAFLNSKIDDILTIVNKQHGPAVNIWWTNRGLIFEDVILEFVNEIIGV